MGSPRTRGLIIGAVALVLVIGLIAAVVFTRTSTPTAESTSQASASPIVSVLSGSPSSAAVAAVGTAETVPCPPSLAAGAAFQAAGTEVEGETYSCGVVVVPENHDKPDGRTIELFYLKLNSTGDSPAADPMVYLAGGPGGSGSYELTANPLLYANLGEIRKDRDIIAYDQRGTGYSNYLLCAPFESMIAVLQDRDANPDIAAAIEDLQKTELGAGYGALRSNLCGVGTSLLSETDPTQYNSVSSARDLPVLTTALGYTDGYSLYGTSYGTRLAQEAMRTVPDGLRGVVLDGVGGPQIPNVMWSITKAVSPYVEIIRLCEADAACAKAYPNLAERFGTVLATISKKPLVFDPPLVVNPALSVVFPAELTQIDPDFFLKLGAINNIAAGGGFAASVPRIITAIEEGDTDYFRSSLLAASASASAAPQTTVPTQTSSLPVFEADRPLYQAPFTTLLSFAQKAAGMTDAGIDTEWLAVVLGDLATRLQAGEDQADLMEALLNLSVVPNNGTTAQQLTGYADAYLSPAAATAANEVVARMSANDVRSTMWTIQDVAMNLNTTPDSRTFSDAMGLAVNCADEIAFSSIDEAKQELAESPYPQLASFPIEFSEQSLLSCLAFPTPLDRSVTDPVTSDIPALLLQGQLDIETPIDWGRTVADALGRATSVEWPNTGHVIAAHDQQLCAGAVAAEFLRNPSSTPDLTCAMADSNRLAFVLE